MKIGSHGEKEPKYRGHMVDKKGGREEQGLGAETDEVDLSRHDLLLAC